jgi:molecular chaperone DnaJ
MAAKRDYYEILSLQRNCSPEELKKTYRKLAIQYHPDKNPGDKAAEEKFKELSEAYEILSDPQKKQMYDQFGHAGVNNGGPGPGGFGGFGGGAGGASMNDIFGDIFGDLFGGGGAGGRRSGTRRRGARTGDDLRTQVDITFEEAAFGAEKVITIPRSSQCEPCHGSGAKSGSQPQTCTQCGGRGEVSFQQGFFAITQPCPQCRGVGQTNPNPCTICSGTGHVKKRSQIAVRIPAGVDTGQRLKLTGEGEAGERGGAAGDLYVVINILPHDFFTRNEADVICEVPITFIQAALGTEVEVPSLDGKVKVKIPTGTQSHKVLRLKGKGLPHLGSYGRGDQLVRVIVEVPTKLTSEQKDLLKRFEEAGSDASHPMHHSFFEKVKNLF